MSMFTVVSGTRALSAGAAILAGLLQSACSDQMPTAPRPVPSRASADRITPTFKDSTIDIPNARSTSLQGINASGDISGFYVDANGRTHGFIFSNGVATVINYPGADNTDERGIGPDGTVVGTHWNVGEEAVAVHGFKRTPDNQFTSVHFPGHLYEIPQRILPDGTILGCRHDHDLTASMHGIAITRRDSVELDAGMSMTNGATPDGHLMVGLYTPMMATASVAFLEENGVLRDLTYPGSTSTSAWDVNPRGDVVGVYANSSGAHGWIRANGVFTSIDMPGATATRVFGTNARGDVVGVYVAGGKTHGFFAQRTR